MKAVAVERVPAAVMVNGRRAWTPEEVAQQLGVSRSTVFRLLRAGELPSIKVGGLRRVTVEQLDQYLAGLSRGRRIAVSDPARVPCRACAPSPASSPGSVSASPSPRSEPARSGGGW